jgi:hypothetical protein
MIRPIEPLSSNENLWQGAVRKPGAYAAGGIDGESADRKVNRFASAKKEYVDLDGEDKSKKPEATMQLRKLFESSVSYYDANPMRADRGEKAKGSRGSLDIGAKWDGVNL